MALSFAVFRILNANVSADITLADIRRRIPSAELMKPNAQER